MKITAIPGATRPIKRSMTINGHRTSVTLEEAFWQALAEAADAYSLSTSALVSQIDRARGNAGLSSAIRVWLICQASGQRSADGADRPNGAEDLGKS